MSQSQRRCKLCGRYTLHARPSAVGGMGCLLIIILTCGLALPLFTLNDMLTPYRCQQCGKGRMS